MLGKTGVVYLQPKSSWEYDATGYMIQPTSLPAPNCNEPPDGTWGISDGDLPAGYFMYHSKL